MPLPADTFMKAVLGRALHTASRELLIDVGSGVSCRVEMQDGLGEAGDGPHTIVSVASF